MSVRVKENKRGLVTVSGLPRDVLDDLLNAASIHTSQSKIAARRDGDAESLIFHTELSQWILLLREAFDRRKVARRPDLKLYIRVVAD